MVNISRSLGDLWSYDTKHDYQVSPIPDVYEYIISPDHDVFMIMASDGLWNVFSPQQAVDFVNSFRQDELQNGGEESEFKYSKVAEALLEEALREWRRRRRAADNITIMIVYFFETEEPPTATGSTKTVHCYYRPSPAALSEIRCYRKSTKKPAILPTDIQLARRFCGKYTLVD